VFFHLEGNKNRLVVFRIERIDRAIFKTQIGPRLESLIPVAKPPLGTVFSRTTRTIPDANMKARDGFQARATDLPDQSDQIHLHRPSWKQNHLQAQLNFAQLNFSGRSRCSRT
jgi:hypothetical protein